jgi:Trypsin-co-occurring domain 1
VDDEMMMAEDDEWSPGELIPRQLVPMKIGEATVYIEQIGEVEVGVSDEIYAAAPDASEVFQTAIEAIGEGVRAVGDRLGRLGDKIHPDEVSVEFSLSFDAKGKAQVIPVFVTTEASIHTGIKVTATWRGSES